MIFRKGLVLDYETLVRALLPDNKVLPLIEKYETEVDFRTPEVCLELASRAVEQTFERRGVDPATASAAFKQFSKLVQPLEHAVHDQFEQVARARLVNEERYQWPVVAAALAFGHPIWAHDEVFLGVGIPVWTIRTVEIYFQ